MDKPKVAFICVHNSCRSQMAEAIAKLKAADAFEAYSAGTETKPSINTGSPKSREAFWGINPDAVAVIKRLYDVDVERTQRPKLLADIPPVDVVITMGCNVACPYLPCRYREDWGLEDPGGKGAEEFERIARVIERKVLELKDKIREWGTKQCQRTGIR